jgi:uncharacterized integral membrane protein
MWLGLNATVRLVHVTWPWTVQTGLILLAFLVGLLLALAIGWTYRHRTGRRWSGGPPASDH